MGPANDHVRMEEALQRAARRQWHQADVIERKTVAGRIVDEIGQGEPLPGGGEAVLMEAGFVPRIVWERVGRTEVMLVVAEKR